MLSALVGALIGGLFTAVVSMGVQARLRTNQEGDLQLLAATEVLGALQNINRKIIDIARVAPGQDQVEWLAYDQAAVRWNSARFSALLQCPNADVELLRRLDVEVDRLFDLARDRLWLSSEFRNERTGLGELAASYVLQVRADTKKGPIDLRTLYSWGPDDLCL